MKRKIYLTAISMYIAIAGNCQFIPMPINYPNPAYTYASDLISIVDASTVWIGTQCYGPSNQVPYPWAVHTTDGGNTWQFDSIPVPGTPVIMSLCALDANTCFYDFSNANWTNSSIWKTVDGGSSWMKKTTTQFTGSGAFCDFYHAFDSNEGVAVGDPTQGYFEVQRTTDGGDTWSRVASSLIPAPLPGEWGLADVYSAVGDNVWFISTKSSGGNTWSARCYRSTDRGQTWTVSPTILDDFGNFKMDFSTAQKGVLVDPLMSTASNNFYRTSDGGDTWSRDSLLMNDDVIYGMSSVPGLDGGFVVAMANTTDYLVNVVFTPDFFSTTVVIDSNLAADPYGLKFKDATNGWLSGFGANANTILKYNGLLTSISNAAKSTEKLTIMPNPTSTEALVKLPTLNKQGDLILMIYNAAGTLFDKMQVESNTGWTKLNASAYNNGVYVLQVISGDRLIASAKWVVQH